jgi:hypothetical protein
MALFGNKRGAEVRHIEEGDIASNALKHGFSSYPPRIQVMH